MKTSTLRLATVIGVLGLASGSALAQNSVTVLQVGEDNLATITQSGSTGSTAGVDQNGMLNVATVTQVAGGSVEVLQVGTQNSVDAQQTANGTATIRQREGAFNSVVLLMNDNGGSFYIEQDFGQWNDTQVTMNGAGGDVLVLQYGVGTELEPNRVLVDQLALGDADQVVAIQDGGRGNYLQVVQDNPGIFDYANVTQSGDFNVAVIAQ